MRWAIKALLWSMLALWISAHASVADTTPGEPPWWEESTEAPFAPWDGWHEYLFCEDRVSEQIECRP
jgi:hypothetical protein